jgi:hypothetical protein
VEFLRRALANGPVMSKQILKDARGIGISERTLWRAKSKLKVKAGKEGFQTEWHWSLPDTKSAKSPGDMADMAAFAKNIGNNEEKISGYSKAANHSAKYSANPANDTKSANGLENVAAFDKDTENKEEISRFSPKSANSADGLENLADIDDDEVLL